MTSVNDEAAMKDLGRRFGERFRGGEVVELVGDVGTGKTTLVKGFGEGLGVDDDVQSPSFTISRVYEARDGLELHHYDFYRLSEAGVMSFGLGESVDDPKTVTVIEWADTVADVLPDSRISIRLAYDPSGSGRTVSIDLPKRYEYLEVR